VEEVKEKDLLTEKLREYKWIQNGSKIAGVILQNALEKNGLKKENINEWLKSGKAWVNGIIIERKDIMVRCKHVQI
jgi:hypothetical protein